MARRSVVFVVVALFMLASCGRADAPDASVAPTRSTAGTKAGAASGPIPYFLFNADGWTLDGGTSSGPVIEAGASLGLKWNVAYTSSPEPHHDVGAALAVWDPPNDGAKGFAASLTSGDAREVSVGGHPAFAGEERNTAGAFIASHIAWDSGDYVVTLTVYETKRDAAVKLAEKISSVSQQQWDAAMSAAAAD